MYLCIRSPKQRYILSHVSRQHFRLKEKEEGFPKWEPWFTSLAPCEARTAETAGSEKTNQTRTDYPDNNIS